jgi:hypothetical protein
LPPEGDMTFQVILEEHTTYTLQFENEREFKEWEEQGSCVSDLNFQNIVLQKSSHDTTLIDND